MNNETHLRMLSIAAVIGLVLVLPARGGAQLQTTQEAAAVDLTGNWVSVITEDWRVRMVTPPKGYYESLPLTAEARRIADAWDPDADAAAGNECKAYGGAAIMRVPGRIRIGWEDSNTLRIDTDAGMQTRLFHFGQNREPAGERTLQGHSVAEWEFADTGRGGPRKGNLKVITTGMREGYLRKNGVPYSQDAVVTEYYDVIRTPNGDEWIVLTTEVVDPIYLDPPFITSTQFRKQPDDAGWNPRPCTVR